MAGRAAARFPSVSAWFSVNSPFPSHESSNRIAGMVSVMTVATRERSGGGLRTQLVKASK